MTSTGLTHQTHGMEDFARYLACCELVSTGLAQFDDRPESYRAWQSSFINAIKDLDLTPSEELDLLVKWLGKESVEHVRRIRSVHINNPDAALRKAWARLNECYVSPEVTERALYRKLDCFPKISHKDYIKLRELGDLLMELNSAKEDVYLPGLAYLDTARGIGPIVEKLPYGLQEKWLSHGSRYKDEHRGHFPPILLSSSAMKPVPEMTRASCSPQTTVLLREEKNSATGIPTPGLPYLSTKQMSPRLRTPVETQQLRRALELNLPHSQQTTPTKKMQRL